MDAGANRDSQSSTSDIEIFEAGLACQARDTLNEVAFIGGSSQIVQRASGSLSSAVQHVGVDFRRSNILERTVDRFFRSLSRHLLHVREIDVFHSKA